MKKGTYITVKTKSVLKGKMLRVNYRSTERFIIEDETAGGGVIVLGNDGIHYCFDLSDDVEVLN